MSANASIVFGCLAEPLHQQLGTSKKQMRLYQKLADCTAYLAVHQCLREAEIHRIRQKIMRLIAADFEENGRRGE